MLFHCVREAGRALAPAWRWPHFSIAELACRCGGRFCGGEYWHDPAFLDELEQVRADMGAPLVITSGHRCALVAAAERAGFTGFGLARSFLHIDRRARPARWFYPGSETEWTI